LARKGRRTHNCWRTVVSPHEKYYYWQVLCGRPVQGYGRHTSTEGGDGSWDWVEGLGPCPDVVGLDLHLSGAGMLALYQPGGCLMAHGALRAAASGCCLW